MAKQKKKDKKKAPLKGTAESRKRPNAGRKAIFIDWEKVDNMAAIHCTGPEIAAVLGVSEDTMTRATKREKKMKFAEYIEQKRGKGRASLRHRQWQAADAGDKTMLVWLGKNWLDQTDKMQQETNIKEESTVIYLPDNGRK